MSNISEVLTVRGLFDSKTLESIDEWFKVRAALYPWANDPETFKRFYGHNVPFFVNIHRNLAEWASEVFNEPLKPSYSFVSRYYDGGICPLHIDRPQCYRTVDWCASIDSQEDWPIRIGKSMTDDERNSILESEDLAHPKDDSVIASIIDSQDWTDVSLNKNDAVLYSGTHQWHYRPNAINGSADLVFFHFVSEDFDGPLS